MVVVGHTCIGDGQRLMFGVVHHVEVAHLIICGRSDSIEKIINSCFLHVHVNICITLVSVVATVGGAGQACPGLTIFAKHFD